MSSGEINPDDRWRLGEEPAEPRGEREEDREPQPPPSHAPTVSNLSRDRLSRAMFVVTAEHLGWGVIAVYALMTRMMALEARPLDPGEARNALAAFAIARHGLGAIADAGGHGAWPTLLQGWIFAQLGTRDGLSLIVVALSAPRLVASAFAMRPYLARARALAFATLLVLSPSATYFSQTRPPFIPPFPSFPF